MIEWLKGNGWWLGAASVAAFICSLGILFALAILMPADHFSRPHSGSVHVYRHPLLRIALRVIRNIAGIILLVAGLAMAVPMIPGPGVLLILVGASLTDIPGKRALGRYIISRPLVLHPINAIRAKWNRPPLELPRDE